MKTNLTSISLATYTQAKEISCWKPWRSIVGSLLFLAYSSDIRQTVKLTLLLYAHDSSILRQHKIVGVIRSWLSEDFENICDWFVDKNIIVHFSEDKQNLFFFASKQWAKTICQLNIKYKNIFLCNLSWVCVRRDDVG